MTKRHRKMSICLSYLIRLTAVEADVSVAVGVFFYRKVEPYHIIKCARTIK